MKSRLRQGQQLIEYLLIFAMVLLVLVLFLRPFGYFHQTVNEAISQAVEHINTEAQRIN